VATTTPLIVVGFALAPERDSPAAWRNVFYIGSHDDASHHRGIALD
jgi:hypothetical protein